MKRRNGAALAARSAAMNTLTRLRGEGVPAVVTADEAFRMTDGHVGTRGDHHSPVSLSRLVTAYPAARHLRDVTP